MFDFNRLFDNDDDFDDNVDAHQEAHQGIYDEDEYDEDDFDNDTDFDNDFDEDDFDNDADFDNDFNEDDFDNDADFDDDEWDDILANDFQDIQTDDDFVFEAYDDSVIEIHQGERGGSSNYMNFDLEHTDLDDIIGDVEEDMSNWHKQEGNTCAVVAQEFILEALTNQEYDMDELRELAEEKGWYDDGTPLWDVGNLLEYHGLEVDKFQGGTIKDIEECLEQGGKIIVSVDSDEVWQGDNDDLFLPGTDADHAVQLIGLDYSDPNNPMVILNDSGVSNGCGAMISMENFMDAWEDSGCFIVTAYEGE